MEDLGVIIDPTLKFDAHVEATVNKAFCSLGFVIRASRCFRQVDSVIHLYRALVAPHLEYASSIWCPYFIKYSDAIESVQRRFTRYVFRKFRLPYSDYETRCKTLKLLTLRRRRMLHDGMMLVKTVRGWMSGGPRVVSISLRA